MAIGILSKDTMILFHGLRLYIHLLDLPKEHISLRYAVVVILFMSLVELSSSIIIPNSNY